VHIVHLFVDTFDKGAQCAPYAGCTSFLDNYSLPATDH